ncbi:hypothetical protein IFM89_031056 [Coptis chinensis]|uniref:Uncharacterized protein n=1 Tax=Coptis chinensis TaxID=261450 RepID=A0A835H9J1_9MAGN|nr:hypothetical protein IFM89_031056 [Coptis chinensis]
MASAENESEREKETAAFNLKEKVENKYKELREHAEAYPYVWASYIFVYGGLALWTTYRWRKLRNTENRVRLLQQRLRCPARKCGIGSEWINGVCSFFNIIGSELPFSLKENTATPEILKDEVLKEYVDTKTQKMPRVTRSRKEVEPEKPAETENPVEPEEQADLSHGRGNALTPEGHPNPLE